MPPASSHVLPFTTTSCGSCKTMPLIQPKQVSAEHRAHVAAGDTSQTVRLRISIIAFSFVLAVYALWQLVAAVIHPRTPYFISAAATEDLAPSAARAAEVAQVRGDFWFDDALLAWLEASRGDGA